MRGAGLRRSNESPNKNNNPEKEDEFYGCCRTSHDRFSVSLLRRRNIGKVTLNSKTRKSVGKHELTAVFRF
ncbi:MAG: hypothetical protein A2X67_11200 [Ignavibacteria bacterium GWA2_55_11]|nr:MAG: hypothetical protein A2X67_11200 [Ignavibacteria bacterium GWA2_55_11]OGU45394.1 MAG: hypothetical protein A2X68_07685 [Ignavibacteria bacterium GWC2_56_12]OGU66575.1 MAG: hypothetical protein A3C56_03290 [Ignavibacteria bacterium RIFCSPHIGHO2_02_FULL_56_12]OGU76721.1 MAG: hypothetical protein A3G43_11935 [Ignavibacteria bacterium RIFCSPLOWO2_12_FULL_56_21]